MLKTTFEPADGLGITRQWVSSEFFSNTYHHIDDNTPKTIQILSYHKSPCISIRKYYNAIFNFVFKIVLTIDLWEKNVVWIEKKFENSRLKVKILQQVWNCYNNLIKQCSEMSEQFLKQNAFCKKFLEQIRIEKNNWNF